MSDLTPYPSEVPSPAPASDPAPAAPTELTPIELDEALWRPRKAPEKKWLVGVLYYGGIDREHDRCVAHLKAHPYVYDVLELTGCPYIDMGRSIIATSVLDNPELGGLLFLDHDMIFQTDEVVRLIEAAEATQAVVGAAYSMRRPGKIIGGVDVTKLPKDFPLVFFDGGAVVPASFLGMGTTAIARSVLVRLVEESEKLYARQQELLAELERQLDTASLEVSSGRTDGRELLAELVRDHLLYKRLPRLSTGISDSPCVPFFSHLQRPDIQAPKGMEGFYYGEDVSFCIRNHDHDIPVKLDTRCRVYHKGSYCYGLEDVGMEVPLCGRLGILDTKTPQVKQGLPNATVAEALAEGQAAE